MNQKLLFAFGAVLLASATVFVILNSNKIEDLQAVKSTKRDDIQNCMIKSCFHQIYLCNNDDNCKQENEDLTKQFFDSPKDYENIFSKAKSQLEKDVYDCFNKSCGYFDYLSRCVNDFVYINNCVNDNECTKENQAYLNFDDSCETKHFKECDSVKGAEAILQCQEQQLNLCESGYQGEFYGKLKDAMQCK